MPNDDISKILKVKKNLRVQQEILGTQLAPFTKAMKAIS